MGTDYFVPFRSDESIAELARRVRKGFDADDLCSFNIISAIRKLEGEEFGSSGKLAIRLFDDDEEDLAYVTFSPLTLNVHRELWDDAELGEPKARFILAHELGHIVMHQHDRQAFSEDAPKANASDFSFMIHLTPGGTTSSFRRYVQIMPVTAALSPGCRRCIPFRNRRDPGSIHPRRPRPEHRA